MGLILNDLGDPKEAIKHLTIALNLNPTKAKYYAQISRGYNLLENYSDAFLFIKETMELAPEEISYKKQAAMIAHEVGNEDEAKFYQKLVQNSENIIKHQRGK